VPSPARWLMQIHERINIREHGERPAAKATGYDYKASLRRLGLGGICNDYFDNVPKPRSLYPYKDRVGGLLGDRYSIHREPPKGGFVFVAQWL